MIIPECGVLGINAWSFPNTIDPILGVYGADQSTLLAGDTIDPGADSDVSTTLVVQPGLYYILIHDADDSDSNADGYFLTLTFTAQPLDVTVLQAGITLSAVTEGVTYQWLDCANANAPIPGADQQDFVPSANGTYAVVLSNGNCTDTSTCIVVNTVGITELSAPGSFILASPNPATDQIRLALPNGALPGSVQVYIHDATGHRVLSSLLSSKDGVINVAALASGSYHGWLVLNNQAHRFRFVK